MSDSPDLKNILVVDDEEIIRQVCKRSLEPRGYVVHVAAHGGEALDVLNSIDPAIVFTDLKMPVMDGMELLEAVKRDYKHVEVVMMTAFATLEYAVRAMKEGAYDFLLKPVKPDQIRLIADRCVDKIQLDQENKELRLANKKLSDIQALKDKFIAITSHELRTPVSHLKGYMGVLDDDSMGSMSPEEKKMCLEVMNKAVDKLEEVVLNMHTLTHLESGRWRLEHEVVDVNKLVEEIKNDYKLIAKRRSLKLESDTSERSLKVYSDPGQIKSMLNELVQNAVKYTPDGGKITITSKLEEGYCVVNVADTGIGIDPAEHGKIFEKFYEVQDTEYHSSSDEAFMGGGLGIGLSSALAIARAHGGRVKVRSKSGQGSEFLVYLPLHRGDAPDA